MVRRRRPAAKCRSTHPLSFERADRECASTASQEAAHAGRALHFPKADTARIAAVWDAGVRCAVMQGGQGEVKHWAFNDPPPRKGQTQGRAAAAAEYRKLTTRVVDLHPMTIARTPAPAAAATSPACRRRRSASARSKPGRPRKSPSGTPASTTTPSAAADRVDDLESGSSIPPCRCRCWPIIPTCSSTTFAAGSGLRGGDALKLPASSYQLPALERNSGKREAGSGKLDKRSVNNKRPQRIVRRDEQILTPVEQYVCGGLVTPPIFECHSAFPVKASCATMLPAPSPANTTLPAVASTPPPPPAPPLDS